MMKACKGWCSCNRNIGLALIRIIVGIVFIYHGYSKITGIEGTIGFFAKLGFGSFLAYLVAYVEFIGGILLVLGVGTSIVGIAFAIIMFVAIMSVKKFEYSRSEFELVLLVVSLGLAFAGSGKYSAQHYSKKWCSCDNCHGKCIVGDGVEKK